jgi:hypothetical protein
VLAHQQVSSGLDDIAGVDSVARKLAAGTRQSELFVFDHTTEAQLYHDTSQFGFFSILYQPKDTKKIQRSYRLPEMPVVLESLPTDRDTWISQAEFTQPNRRVINLTRLSLLFCDIDCYKLDIDPNDALLRVYWVCDQMNFPHPSVSIHSGRGLQIKWLHHPIPRHALPRWNLCQSKLVDLFEHLGADAGAKDASRVLRLVQTVNTKSNRVVEVIATTTGKDGHPEVNGFDYLAEFLTDKGREHFDQKLQNHPFTDAEKDAMTQARIKRERAGLQVVKGGRPAASRSGFSARQLSWHRVEDIRKLVEIRGGVKQGQSMSTLFWSLNFLLLSGATNSGQMYLEATALCKEFGFGEFKRHDELSTLYQRAKEYEAGKTVCWNGRELPALYTPKNSTLIDLFQITPDEMKLMRTIITKDEKLIRRTEVRRKAGEVSRATYLSANDGKRATARLMRSKGNHIRFIADTLCVAVGTVHGWCK